MNISKYEFIRKHVILIAFLIGLSITIFALFALFANPRSSFNVMMFQVGGAIFAISLLIAFWQFFTSERRIKHQFNALHGSSALSGFYKIYFPIIILSIVVQVVVVFALLPESNPDPTAPTGWGLLDPDVSPSGYIAISIIPSIVVGICLILLSDLEMKKSQILYAPRRKNLSTKNALFYTTPLVGLYFGFTVLLRFILELSFGPGALIPISPDIYRVDGSLIDASRFWIFLTKRERILTLFAFLLLYIGLEFLFRGLIGNQMRAMGLGAGGLVFVPAIVQAFALSSGNLLFTDHVYYLYVIFEAILFGTVLGIILWRTGRFGISVFTAILIRFLDSTSDFHRTCLNLLPRAFGEYDPADTITTTADQIGTYITFFQIILIIFAPFIMLASYNETWKVISTLVNDLRNQWFGYLVLGFAFFLIDLIFSYFAAESPFLPIIGFLLALLVIGFVLGFLFKVLPQPDILTAAKLGHEDGSIYNINTEYPLNPLQDIKYLESEQKWYQKPKQVGIITSFLYFYLLFLSGAYRQYTLLTLFEGVQYSIFLIILPSVFLGLSAYFVVISVQRGYYFGEDWRKSLITILIIILCYNLVVWTVSGSLAQYSWRNMTWFIVFLLVVYPKPLRTPIKEFSTGFSREGRVATFNFISAYPDPFIKAYEDLLELGTDQALVGSKIMASKLNILKEWEELETLRESQSSITEKIASTFALGIMKAKSSEGALIKQIETEDLNLKIVSYWALGKLGSSNSLSRMAQILEESPLKDLVPIAEKAILSIDPYYPLAGLRDNITFE